MSEATDTTTGSDELSSRITVGIIVGIAGIATILIMLVLYAMMICKYCFYKRNKRHLRTAGGVTLYGGGSGYYYGSSTGTGTFTKEFSRQDSYNMSPRTRGYSASGDNTLESTDGVGRRGRRYTHDDIQQQKRRTYVGSRQFPNKNLVLLTMLAEGEYGPVYRGEAYEIVPREASRIVMVKMLKEGAEDTKRVMFEQEITLLSHLNHLNVVGLLGVCTDTTPGCIILDAGTTHIDLLGYVRDRGKTMRGINDGQRIIEEFRDLLRIADEVCLGLTYLESQNIVHKDVALRNCIRGQNGVVKVSSFGLGSKLYPEAYHYLHGRQLPIRWMAPESINHDMFAMETDIWSFGVLMWELITYGEQPFHNLNNNDVMIKVAQQYSALSAPDKCPEDVFLVMSSCWNHEPTSRPKFLVLHQHIFDLISPHLAEDHGN